MNSRAVRLVLDPSKCTGCRACEVACSFRRHRSFNPLGSSIHVVRALPTDEVEWYTDSTCDLCRGSSRPYCIRFCPENALYIELC